MDSGTILIASFMILSMGRTTVSGLNFDPSFFILKKGSKARFLLPLLRDQGPSCRPERNALSGSSPITLGPGANQEEAGLSPSIPKSRDLVKEKLASSAGLALRESVQ